MDSSNKHDNKYDFPADMTLRDFVNYYWLRGGPEGAEVADLTADQFNKAMRLNSSNASLPKPGESASISFRLPKTSALCYDRVFGFFGSDIPEDIRFGGNTEGEVGIFALNLLISCDSQGIPPHPSMLKLLEEKFLYEGLSRVISIYDFGHQMIAVAYAKECGLPVVPVFNTEKEAGKILHKPGDSSVLVTTLSDLAVIDEEKLVWAQVQQFREDKDARAKLRRLLHWLDAEMINKPQSFVSDEISKRLDEYEWALKKHGIMTLLGTITSALDGKFLAGASATGAFLTLLEKPGLATLAATGLVLTKAVVAISERLIELENIRRGPNSEVAFIQEVKKLTEKV